MKSKAERLRDIVKCSAKNVTEASLKKAEEAIIALFKECVPENITLVELESKYDQGWRHCRTETLKNIEELR